MRPLPIFGSELQYFHHLLPIWRALDDSERGLVYCRPDLPPLLAARGVDPAAIVPGYPPPDGDPIAVASYQDARHVGRRGYVYVEHGAGQSYDSDIGAAGHGSYSGGDGHDRALLFLTPGETVAARWRARYPEIPAVPVGVPKLDWRHANDGWRIGGRVRLATGRPNLGLAFHARNPLCPESNTAWMEYAPVLPTVVGAIRNVGFGIVAHAHPRIAGKVRPAFERLGVDFVADFGDLLDLVDVYAADNTSTLPEAASCGIPLVWINSRHYRREVEHGCRFWSWPRGQVSCDRPEDLAAAAALAVTDPPEIAEARRRMVEGIYLATDGNAAARAVDAIRAVLR